MLTIEEYISQMKKRDKLNEFNFTKHAENMATTIRYVTDYFNNYLNPETYDYEKIKLEQTALKVEKEVSARYPQSKEFIIEYYMKHKSRIDRYVKSYCKDKTYFKLFYIQEEYEKLVDDFCNDRNLNDVEIEQFKEKLIILAQEIKKDDTQKISLADFKYLGSELTSWVKRIYREYRVNLFEFAQDYTYEYYKIYVEHIHDRQVNQTYLINKYNYRYISNPFDIDELYEENAHRVFINGKKGELEMLIMYSWLFEDVHDEEYWPEYVNLCVASRRVSLVTNINVLLPVRKIGLNYPEDIQSNIIYRETRNGEISNKPIGAYILRIVYGKEDDNIWKNQQELDRVIKNLHHSFNEYGVPKIIEIASPLRLQNYNEEEFFRAYEVFERSIRKYGKVKLALINGSSRHVNSKKPKYLMESVEDIIRISDIIKEMKLKLRLALNITTLFNQGRYEKDFKDGFNRLSVIRSMIIGVHLSCIPHSMKRRQERKVNNHIYLSQYEYNRNSDYLGDLSALFNDTCCRYLIPENIEDDNQLEELIDILLRGGFSFVSEDKDNEK